MRAVCSDSLCLNGALSNATSTHVDEQSRISLSLLTIITTIAPENVVAIATAIAKDMAMHVMQHLVVLRIARPRFQAIHTAVSN
jgi:hypothetical protein